jgi:hypothetical protein
MDPELPVIQSRLAHEDDLINQRISWLMSLQSFLLTAYAITLNGLAGDIGRPEATVQRKLLELLPTTGIACVILVGIAVIGGMFALSELRRIAIEKFPSDRVDIICSPRIQFLGISAPILIPLVFLFIWIAILFASNR